MIYPDILGALARERSATFLAEAEAARRARQARLGRTLAAASGAGGSSQHWLVGLRRPGRGLLRSSSTTPGITASGSRGARAAARAPRAAVIAPGGPGHDGSPRSWGRQC